MIKKYLLSGLGMSLMMTFTACKKESMDNLASPSLTPSTNNNQVSGRTAATETICLGNLPSFLLVITDGSTDANWQGATKGFRGDVAVNGMIADIRTSGSVPFAGNLFTNTSTQGSWEGILNQNSFQSTSTTNQTGLISTLKNDLDNAFAMINNKAVTVGFEGVSSTSLNGMNTENGINETFVINITSGLSVSSKINITGDAGDIFILRWDSDGIPTNGYQGTTKFQSGGAIVPNGQLKPTNFINVAGNISSSGGGSNPAPPYPQGPRYDNGLGSLITNGSNFNGGGFFTGYWLTTGDPITGETQSLSNAIFVGGWFTTSTKFSMTSGTSGVYVGPVINFNCTP